MAVGDMSGTPGLNSFTALEQSDHRYGDNPEKPEELFSCQNRFPEAIGGNAKTMLTASSSRRDPMGTYRQNGWSRGNCRTNTCTFTGQSGTGRGGAVAISQATTFALMNCDGDILLGFSRLKNECPSG